MEIIEETRMSALKLLRYAIFFNFLVQFGTILITAVSEIPTFRISIMGLICH
jgi:hypothetical protein